MSGSPYLTRPNEALEKMADATVPGMAHWAGSGPPGKTCRTCKYFGNRRDFGGKVRLRRCSKYTALTQKIGPEPIPAVTAACRHYDPKRI